MNYININNLKEKMTRQAQVAQEIASDEISAEFFV